MSTTDPSRLRYHAYTNVADLLHRNDRAMMRLNGYEPDDPLVASHSGLADPSDGLDQAAEAVFVALNRPDRPNGDTNPSMSVGDIVVFHTPDGPATYAVAPLGFEQVKPVDDDQVLDTDWKTLIDTRTGRSDG